MREGLAVLCFHSFISFTLLHCLLSNGGREHEEARPGNTPSFFPLIFQQLYLLTPGVDAFLLLPCVTISSACQTVYYFSECMLFVNSYMPFFS